MTYVTRNNNMFFLPKTREAPAVRIVIIICCVLISVDLLNFDVLMFIILFSAVLCKDWDL
jgi:hypothetical protein